MVNQLTIYFLIAKIAVLPYMHLYRTRIRASAS